MQVKNMLLAIGCGLAFALAPGYGQAGPGMGVGTGAGGATPVPQYWISDADIFIGNGIHTAAVLAQEQRIATMQPDLFGTQVNFLNNAISRALKDMQSLNAASQTTAPAAVPAIQDTINSLMAAQAQTQQLAQLAASGAPGPAYRTTVGSALQHLQNSARSLTKVSQQYPGTRVLTVVMMRSYQRPATAGTAGTGRPSPAGAAGAQGTNGQSAGNGNAKNTPHH